ncbi:alpha/beta-hydrolase N-terminal domain-containing protein [Arsenicicoccus bolidensis]|uniref:Alpha/beta-hydrolase N-terminal domain-containing protein n=1 Tax=Arsenicicoccus bolidensis TaxID=229480 RepID=A0ABS9PZC5_9MICO|nr:alpha/beta-hydrolase N-terminal domain-containing protein [Arsenicicoccus bolidensis]MCG7320985.1 hypothetical protein [Arsenicicoccus bolidensis]
MSAQVASSVVALNSWRQLGGVPQETPAVQASLAASAAGVLSVGALALPGRRRRAAAAALRARLPGALTSALVAVAVLVSLAPSLLPRPAVVQGPLTGVLVAVALGVGGVVRLVWRSLPPRRSLPVGRGHALAVGGGLVVAGVAAAHRYQEGLATRLEMAGPDATYWPAVLTLAVVVTLLLTVLARGVGLGSGVVPAGCAPCGLGCACSWRRVQLRWRWVSGARQERRRGRCSACWTGTSTPIT